MKINSAEFKALRKKELEELKDEDLRVYREMCRLNRHSVFGEIELAELDFALTAQIIEEKGFS